MSKKLYKIISYNKINNGKIKNILDLERVNFSYSQYSYNDMKDFNNNNDIHFFIVYDLEKIIGYCIFFESIDFYEIYKIFIKEDYRCKGIASAIIDLLNQKKVFVEVNHTNTTALSFYENLGFKQINRRKKYYQDNADAIILERK